MRHLSFSGFYCWVFQCVNKKKYNYQYFYKIYFCKNNYNNILGLSGKYLLQYFISSTFHFLEKNNNCIKLFNSKLLFTPDFICLDYFNYKISRVNNYLNGYYYLKLL